VTAEGAAAGQIRRLLVNGRRMGKGNVLCIHIPLLPL